MALPEPLVYLADATPKVEAPFVPESSLYVPPIAFISDLHIGAPADPGHETLMTGERFIEQCGKLAENRRFVPIAVFDGDILDQAASQEDVTKVQEGLEILARAGIRVLFVIGNNEDRLKKGDDPLFTFSPDVQDRIQELDEGLVVIDYSDALGHAQKVAFVVESRIIPPEKHRKIWRSRRSEVGKVVAQRKLLNGGKLKRFERNLADTVVRREDPRTGEVHEERIPVFIVHHAPEDVRLYPNTNIQAIADNWRIRISARYTRAVRRHQRKHGNVVGEVYGHVEGGFRYVIRQMRKGRDYVAINACGVVNGDDIQTWLGNADRPVVLD